MAPSRKAHKRRQPVELYYANSSNHSDHNFLTKSEKYHNIAELVYGFLSNLAVKNMEKKMSDKRRLGKKYTSIKKSIQRRRKSRRRRKSKQSLFDKGNTVQSEVTRQTSLHLTESRSSGDTTKRTLDESGSSNKTATSKDKKEEDSMKKRSLMQMINKYIKNGFEKGKYQAKMFVKKALSLAVDNGYLIPADQEGTIFRVSTALSGTTLASRRASVEARKRRRSMRRGEEYLKKNEQKNTKKSDTNETTTPRNNNKEKKALKQDVKSRTKSNRTRRSKASEKKKILEKQKSKKRKSKEVRQPSKSQRISRKKEEAGLLYFQIPPNTSKKQVPLVQSEIKNNEDGEQNDEENQVCQIIEDEVRIKNEPLFDKDRISEQNDEDDLLLN